MTKRPRPASPRGVPPEALAERGTADLEAGRFKEAVEALRTAVKAEPRPDWQRLLGRACAGRARTLAAKDMAKEAAFVFDNADAADGTIHDPLVHLACLLRSGDAAGAARLCARCLDGEAAAALDGADRARIADLAAALWLTGHPPPGAAAGGHPLDRAAAAAEAALAAWTGGAPADEVERWLEAIPLRSPFRPLRLVLKALAATGDDVGGGRRMRLLDMVPPESAFTGLARAARLAIDEDAERLPAGVAGLSNAARSFVAEARGLAAASLRLAAELESAAGEGGTERLFDLLLKQGDRFPAETLRAACLNLLPRAPRRLPAFERRFGRLDPAERYRILALAAEQEKDWNAFEHNWELYAEALDSSADPDAALMRAIAYRHLADRAEEVLSLDEPLGREDPIADWLEKSIAAAPDDRDTLLKLIGRLGRTGRVRERDRWIDLAAGRFPNDPAMLTEALEAAARRGSFRKASTFADRLLAVDPINALARQHLIDLRIAHARKKLRENRPDLADKALDEAARRDRRDSPDGALAIARGLTLVRAGQAEAGWARLAEGVQRLGGGVAGWLRALLEARAAGFGEKALQPLIRNLRAAMSAEPTGEEVIAATSVLNRRDFRDPKTLAAGGLAAIRGWLGRGADLALSAAEVQAVAETLERLDGFDLLARYAEQAAAREPGEPIYQLYRIAARTQGRPERLSPDDADALHDMAQAAVDRKDFRLVSRIRALLGMAAPALQFGPAEEEDAFDELFDDAGDEGGPGGGLPSPAAFAVLDEIAERAMDLVRTLPVDEVIDRLVEEYAASPLGRGLPKAALRALMSLVVHAAAERGGRGGRPARRRKMVNR